MNTVRIDYDDDQLDIIDKINKALEVWGLRFEDDMQEHDGFILLTLEDKDDK
jgi:hypothetical protein